MRAGRADGVATLGALGGASTMSSVPGKLSRVILANFRIAENPFVMWAGRRDCLAAAYEMAFVVPPNCFATLMREAWYRMVRES